MLSTPEQSLDHALSRHREAARAQGVPDLNQRKQLLERLLLGLKKHTDLLCAAVDKDFAGRSRHETLGAEIMSAVNDIKHTRKNLKKWMAPRKKLVSPLFLPASAMVMYQPKGVVGIISPWNYPILLVLAPLVAAIGAGNRAMIKPSEYAPHTADALAKLMGEVFDDDMVSVHLGGPDVAKAMSKLELDHLVFTGSSRVGKMVMGEAAKNLVPVTLELGGKSPAIIHHEYPIEKAAERIALGKLLNAGQTCIAPDYVLLVGGDANKRVDEFVTAMQKTVGKFYPTLANNPDYTSIINEKQQSHLARLLDDAKTKGATLVEINTDGNGETNISPTRRLQTPMLVLDTTDDMEIMSDEIFGPLLPVLACKTLIDAINYVNARPHPLALYYFDNDKARSDMVLQKTISGGACINETLFHFAQQNLPFGGIGQSGMGRYHGFDGFETLSHKRGVFKQSRWGTASLANPPYGSIWEQILKFVLR